MNTLVFLISATILLNSSIYLQKSRNLIKASDKWADADGGLYDLFVDSNTFKKKGDTLYFKAHYIGQTKDQKSLEFTNMLLFSRCSPNQYVPEELASEEYKYEWNKIIAIYKQTLKKKKSSLPK